MSTPLFKKSRSETVSKSMTGKRIAQQTFSTCDANRLADRVPRNVASRVALCAEKATSGCDAEAKLGVASEASARSAGQYAAYCVYR